MKVRPVTKRIMFQIEYINSSGDRVESFGCTNNYDMFQDLVMEYLNNNTMWDGSDNEIGVHVFGYCNHPEHNKEN